MKSIYSQSLKKQVVEKALRRKEKALAENLNPRG